MTASPIYCSSSVVIRNGQVWKNGDLIVNRQDLSPNEFLRACYDAARTAYPKFFKMDNLCKLAWVAAELLQQGTDFINAYSPEEKGIILANCSSSLDTDIKHAESIAKADSYFPSPAVFVYTLPNITAGEICIRQQIKGSSAFFIFDAFDADLLYQQANIYVQSNRVKACILGTTEWMQNSYEACLFLVEKSSTSAIKKELTTELIKTVYTPS